MENITVAAKRFYDISEDSPQGQKTVPGAWKWVCDQKGKVLACSDEVIDTLGYSADTLLNKPLGSVMRDRKAWQAISAVSKSSDLPMDIQVKMESRTGVTVKVMLSIQGVREKWDGSDRQHLEVYGVAYPLPAEYGKSANQQERQVQSPGEKRQDKYYSSGKKKNETNARFLWMALPLVFFILFGVALLLERKGPIHRSDSSAILFLDAPQVKRVNPALVSEGETCLLLYDSKGIEGPDLHENMRYVLDSMRVEYDAIDVAADDMRTFDRYQSVVIALTDLEKISTDALALMDWVEKGGRLLFAIRPDPSATFTAIYRKLGILLKYDELQIVNGVDFQSEIVPGAKSMDFDDQFLSHSSLIVTLSDQSNVHITSMDRYALPLLWDYGFGDGRIVFINSDQFTLKSARGTLAAAYSLMFDVFAYPVINSSVFFIDDFPAPIRQGTDANITRDYGRDLNSFFTNIWWPDMQSLSRRFGIRYTGALLETFDEGVTPPFTAQQEQDTFKYFGTSLLKEGGEIGYLGYNRIPLCLNKMECSTQLNYAYWESKEGMQEALEELQDFSGSLYAGEVFSTYVPPSNILSANARDLLPEFLPGVRVIASVYIPDEESYSYVQEFEEAEDGLIEMPRITSGYILTDFMRWTALNELSMHYVQAHYINQDGVLEQSHCEDCSWSAQRDGLEDHILWLTSTNPYLRQMTARDGAMALQRYTRLTVDRFSDGQNHIIRLDHFYDQAWLLLRSRKELSQIEGGHVEDLGSGLYLLQATGSEITIQFEE